jgi:CRISPR-associated protein Cmr5
MAQIAYQCIQSVADRGTEEMKEDYSNLAKKFPALVQACGLAQTVAFVQAKQKETNYLVNLAQVMEAKEELGMASREANLMKYQLLSGDAIEAGSWLKRYAEALLEIDETKKE